MYRMQNLLNEMDVEQADWTKLRTLEHVSRLYFAGAFQFNVTLQDARTATAAALATDDCSPWPRYEAPCASEHDTGGSVYPPADYDDARAREPMKGSADRNHNLRE